MIGIGSEVNVSYGSGDFKRDTTGVVVDVKGNKYKVKIKVGNEDTHVISTEVSLVDNGPAEEIDLVALGLEMNPDDVDNSSESVDNKSDEDKWMKPMRYDLEFMGPIPTNYRIAGRQKIRGIRHYVVCFEDQREPWFLPSVTSVIDKVMPKDENFIKYMVNNFGSYDEFKEWLDGKAGFGTVVHGAIADFVNGVLPEFEDNDAWHAYMSLACERAGCKSKASAWTEGVKECIIDFWKWVYDYQVRIIMLEQPLASRKWGIAGQLDLLVEMNSHIQKKTGKNAVEPTRVIAVVDIKTGDAMARYNGQVGMYGLMLHETFPGLQRMLNDKYKKNDGSAVTLEYGIFTPKTFRSEPKYTFVWRTDKVMEYMADTFQHHMVLFKQQLKKPGNIRIFKGKPDFNTQLEDVITYKTLEQEWIDRISSGNYGSDVDITVQDDEDDEES